jgi:hypothetical protein
MKNIFWGDSNHIDDMGAIVADSITRSNLTLMNTGTKTHFYVGAGSCSKDIANGANSESDKFY